MTSACHHLCPMLALREDLSKVQKAVLSIAGAKIQHFWAECKLLP